MARNATTIDIDVALARVPRVQRPPLPLRIWYWRHAAAAMTIPVGLVELGAAIDPAAPAAVVATAVLSAAFSPDLRRWVLARWRCTVVPHRVRSTFLDGAVCSPDGRTPIVLWTSPLPSGVRVRLRCPIGMRTREVAAAADLLQAACGADEVLVVRDPGSRIVILGFRFAPRGHWWER